MDRGTTAVRTFAEAAARHRDLTERQLDVLRLVAGGRTNWEIGEALGITIDGAKWHVSELLTKLGLSSREELAGYWRWHNRRSARAGRALRGLLALPALKIVGGAAAAATLAGVAVSVWSLFGNTDDAATPRVPPFELVARATVLDNSLTIGTSIAGSAGNPFGPEERETVFRWNVKDATHFRMTIETVRPAFDANTLVVARAGDTMLTYDTAANTYSVAPFQPASGPWVMPLFSITFGPVPFDTTQAFIKSLLQTGRGSSKQVKIVGEETILGRKVSIIQLRPAITSRGSDGIETASGSMRFWLDEERMFVMRASSDGGSSGQSYELQITELNYAMPAHTVDAGFSPPPGAKEVAGDGGSLGSGSAVASPAGGSASSTGVLGGPGPVVMHGKPGFLAAAHLPEGYSSTGEGSESNSRNEPVALENTFVETASTGQRRSYLRIEQRKRADGLPAALLTRDQTTVNGHPAYRGANGDAKTIAWAQDGLAIIITADTLPYAELERIANSMTLQ